VICKTVSREFMTKLCHYMVIIHRNTFDLHTCYCSTVLYKRSVINMGIKLFDKLLIQVQQLDNHNSFKRKVKKFLLHNSF
jgi:hypothetical protein